MSQRTNIRTSRMQQYIRELLREEGLESDSDEHQDEQAEEIK